MRLLKFRELLSNINGYSTNISDPILVTEYFQLDILIKGEFAGAGTPQFYIPEHYKNWIAYFAFIGNIVAFYSDDRHVLEQFRSHRESNPILANLSHIQLMHRYSKFLSQNGTFSHSCDIANALLPFFRSPAIHDIIQTRSCQITAA